MPDYSNLAASGLGVRALGHSGAPVCLCGLILGRQGRPGPRPVRVI